MFEVVQCSECGRESVAGAVGVDGRPLCLVCAYEDMKREEADECPECFGTGWAGHGSTRCDCGAL
jgi:hypothetical protein